MKCAEPSKSAKVLESLPVRGAWIEIPCTNWSWIPSRGRSPCGERGLKCKIDYIIHTLKPSLPVRGAWIEI